MSARKGRCSLCDLPVAGRRCERCAAQLSGPGSLAEKLDRLAIAPAPAPVKLRGFLSTPIPTSNAPRCSACGDLGPCAREDGWRYDSAGPLFPCPDCGISTSEVQIANVLGCHPAELSGGAR